MRAESPLSTPCRSADAGHMGHDAGDENPTSDLAVLDTSKNAWAEAQEQLLQLLIDSGYLVGGRYGIDMRKGLNRDLRTEKGDIKKCVFVSLPQSSAGPHRSLRKTGVRSDTSSDTASSRELWGGLAARSGIVHARRHKYGGGGDSGRRNTRRSC
jgi:hypothetical protein